ncbi:hypothetical protein HOY82DRAFT_614796 [Tuber indicum]|nr:hypothetical protein HOY82DRAFT_614796 [Tuber indicum]
MVRDEAAGSDVGVAGPMPLLRGPERAGTTAMIGCLLEKRIRVLLEVPREVQERFLGFGCSKSFLWISGASEEPLCIDGMGGFRGWAVVLRDERVSIAEAIFQTDTDLEAMDRNIFLAASAACGSGAPGRSYVLRSCQQVQGSLLRPLQIDEALWGETVSGKGGIYSGWPSASQLRIVGRWVGLVGGARINSILGVAVNAVHCSGREAYGC